jgi:transcription elongation factor Elf1
MESFEADEKSFISVRVDQIRCLSCGEANCALLIKTVVKKKVGKVRIATVVCVDCHLYLDIVAVGNKTKNPVWFEII